MGTHYNGTESEKLALDTFIKLSRAAEATSQRINDHLRRYDLTTSQFGVLEALYHLGPLQTGQLGEKILKSSGNMTMVVDNLVRRALVRRQRREEDRRCVEIHLTDVGGELVESILPAHVSGVEATISILTVEEQVQLGTLCRKLGLGQM